MTGDRNEKLYEAYYMRVFSYAVTLTDGDRSEAEEITQETFFRAFSRQKDLSFSGHGSVKGE